MGPGRCLAPAFGDDVTAGPPKGHNVDRSRPYLMASERYIMSESIKSNLSLLATVSLAMAPLLVTTLVVAAFLVVWNL